jgi:hypothetical protein
MALELWIPGGPRIELPVEVKARAKVVATKP